MTNDSHLFRTAVQLDSAGFYPVQGNCWKRGEEMYLPLYEGKMVQAFDHRAASVVVNRSRISFGRPSHRVPQEHSDTGVVLPSPQFWVPRKLDVTGQPIGMGYSTLSISLR